MKQTGAPDVTKISALRLIALEQDPSITDKFRYVIQKELKRRGIWSAFEEEIRG